VKVREPPETRVAWTVRGRTSAVLTGSNVKTSPHSFVICFKLENAPESLISTLEKSLAEWPEMEQANHQTVAPGLTINSAEFAGGALVGA